MFALIHKNQVVQIEPEQFPVAGMQWVDCDTSIEVGYYYVDDQFKKYLKSDEEILLEIKKERRGLINEQRDDNRDKDVLHSIGGVDHYFQRDIISNLAWINNIQSMDDVAVSRWATSDNIFVDLTKSDLLSICSHIRERDSEEVYQARKRKDAIEDMETIEEIESYDITTIYE